MSTFCYFSILKANQKKQPSSAVRRDWGGQVFEVRWLRIRNVYSIMNIANDGSICSIEIS
jgi:hypothetical protein